MRPIICGLSGSTIFFKIISKGKIFWKKKNVTEHKMCVLFSSTNFMWNISHSKTNTARYNHKLILVFRQSTRYSFRILIKLEFSTQIFEKYSNIKLRENPSSGRWVGPCGQADRHNEANSRFSRFYERGKKKTQRVYQFVQMESRNVRRTTVRITNFHTNYVHCLTYVYIQYTRRFGPWLHDGTHATCCHYTATFSSSSCFLCSAFTH
jgi:hypothetical protein